jgi:hypothetical protein
MDFSLSKIFQGIKGSYSREINKIRDSKGPIWQNENYDRILRDYEEYLEKRRYIRGNPVRDGLSQAPEEYPFLREPGEAVEE